jgi:nucleotide-binding universal stress UspA family protein
LVEKILVPVDGSKVMERNIKFACDLVKDLGGTLTLVHVVVLPASMEPGVPIDPTPLEQAGTRILEAAQKMVETDGGKADTILETDFGNAGHRIVRVAQERGFTLIVIGARGGSKIMNLLLGSVCHTVAHSATCPVLIVRPQ